jgi:hypothetical protein
VETPIAKISGRRSEGRTPGPNRFTGFYGKELLDLMHQFDGEGLEGIARRISLGLGHVVACTQHQGIHRGLRSLRGKRAEHDDPHIEAQLDDPSQRGDAIQLGHLHIEGHDMRPQKGNLRQSIESVARGSGELHRRLVLDHPRDQATDYDGVVDDKHADPLAWLQGLANRRHCCCCQHRRCSCQHGSVTGIAAGSPRTSLQDL